MLAVGMALGSMTFPVGAQMNDWATVQRLDLGTDISLTLLNHPGRRECEVIKVTESELTCEMVTQHLERRYAIPRNDIREVRLEHPERHHGVRGAFIGAGIGAALGKLLSAGSNDSETRAAGPLLGGIVGLTVGIAAGVHDHQHGAVVYQIK